MTTTAFYSPPISSIGGSVQAPTYVIFQIGGTIYAQSSAGAGFQAYSGTDAATVIQNAINALASTGGTIWIRAGTYTITTPVTVNSNGLNIFGEGIDATILKGGTALNSYAGTLGDAIISLSSTAPIKHVTLQDFTVDASVVTNTAFFEAVGLNSGSPAQGPSDNVTFRRLKFIPMDIAGTDAIAFYDNGTANTNVLVESCIVDGSNLTGSHVLSGYGVFTDVTMIDCIAQNVKSTAGSASHGYDIESTNLAVLIGCEATSCDDGYNLGVTSGRNTLVGCLATKCNSHGCIASTGGPATLLGCAFTNNNQKTSNSGAGLNVAGQASNLVAVGCDLRDTQGTPTQKYGLLLTSFTTSAKVVVEDCDVTGNVNAGVSVPTSAMPNVVLSAIKGYTPVGLASLPFSTVFGTKYTIHPSAAAAAPVASTDYIVSVVPVFVTSVGGTGVSITLKDSAGNTIQSGLATLTQQYVPIGYQIDFGGFSVGPTVTVWGQGD